MTENSSQIKKEEMAVDVLIIGAGITGLVLAAWLARCDVKVVLIDNKSDPPQSSSVELIEPRTWEILDSFGFAAALYDTAVKIRETSIWSNAEDDGGWHKLAVPVYGPDTTRFSYATMDGNVLQRTLLRHLKAYQNVQILRNTSAVDSGLQEDSPYPVKLSTWTFKRSGRNSLGIQTYCAKYVIGCDGVNSWLRKQLEISFDGRTSDSLTCSMDIIPVTNFPDIRSHCIITSENHGTVEFTPGDKNLVRVCVQLDQSLRECKNLLEEAVTMVSKIMSPYRFNAKRCEWSATHQTSHRMASTISANDRFFLCGGAIHDQSSHTGSLNASIQDAYNLGWKVAEVVKDYARPPLLASYSTERYSIDRKLVGLDAHSFYTIYDNKNAKHAMMVGKTINDQMRNTSGACINYARLAPDLWAGKRGAGFNFSKSFGTPGVTMGKRIPDVCIFNQSDALSTSLHKLLACTGHWRLLVFPGSISTEPLLPTPPASPSPDMKRTEIRNTTSIQPPTTLLELCDNENLQVIANEKWRFRILTVHSSRRECVDLTELPRELVPYSDEDGFAYDRVFYDDEAGSAYTALFGDPGTASFRAKDSRLILVRPDLHVAFVGGFNSIGEVADVLNGLSD